MTTSIRILTTATLDSSPSLLIAAPDGSKTLINCGEGCQRSFLESSSTSSGSLKVKSVKRICLTSLGHDSLGGLPGFVLTAADASEIILASNVKAMASANDKSGSPTGNMARKRKFHPPSKKVGGNGGDGNGDGNRPGLDIIGPPGTKAFLRSLRHFMRRDKFQVSAYEGRYCDTSRLQTPSDATACCPPTKRSKPPPPRQDSNEATTARSSYDAVDQGQETIRVHSIPFSFTTAGATSKDEEMRLHSCSYIFNTPPIPGKFRPDKAKALGIPPGPLYGRLKSGMEVTYVSTTGEERRARPEDVLDEGSAGVAVAVLFVPNLEVLDALKKESSLMQYSCCPEQNSSETSDVSIAATTSKPRCALEVMVHITSRDLFESESYQNWLSAFNTVVIDHLTLYTMKDFDGGGEEYDGTPFRSAAILGAMSRATVNCDVFLSPFDLDGDGERKLLPACGMDSDRSAGQGVAYSARVIKHPNVIQCRPLMEYVLIPRKRRGLAGTSHKYYHRDGISSNERREVGRLVNESGAVNAAEKALRQHQKRLDVSTRRQDQREDHLGELIFTGTGSALPCKHRNVTGMYMRMSNGRAIMLDVGEGTTGQLLRCWKHHQVGENGDKISTTSSEEAPNRCVRFERRLIDIRAIWISHPHADHHVGIVRLLTERAEALRAIQRRRSATSVSHNKQETDPLVLIAPPAMFRFLEEYELLEPGIRGAYMRLDCRDMLHGKLNPMADRLRHELGITTCFSVPVAHCPHSYAIVMDGTVFGRVVYSGDCRPSDQLAQFGRGADLLIHEATFENGMEMEATIKRHSTVGEALSVGRKMDAKAIVLTHFSQRYPRIPTPKGSNEQNSSDTEDVPVVFAFDFMRLIPANLRIAALLTPSLRMLYPDSDVNNDRRKEEIADSDILMETSLKDQPSAKDLLAVPGAFAAANKQPLD